MSLDQKELERLQKLACIKLSSEEQAKLGSQLQGIIAFLDKLQEIKIDSATSYSRVDPADCHVPRNDSRVENPLRTLEGVHQFDDSKALLANVKHEKINNSIVIKSVLS